MKKLVSLLLTLSCVIVTFTSCAGKVKMNSLSPKQLLSISDVADDTLMDELIENGYLNHYGTDMDIVSAAEQLENYLNTIDRLKDMDFSQVPLLEPLSDEDKDSVTLLSYSDIATLIEQSQYKGNEPVKQEKKLHALKLLKQLYDDCISWVSQNGQSISIRYMMSAIKAALADELDLPLDQYPNIEICGVLSKDSDDDFSISVNGHPYTVKWSAHGINNAISYTHACQNANLAYDTESDRENAFETFRKSLNFAKVVIAEGMNVDDKDRITTEKSDSYVESVYVKRK